jgi:hypothetical protein
MSLVDTGACDLFNFDAIEQSIRKGGPRTERQRKPVPQLSILTQRSPPIRLLHFYMPHPEHIPNRFQIVPDKFGINLYLNEKP